MSSLNPIQDIALKAERLFRDHVLQKGVPPAALLAPPEEQPTVPQPASRVAFSEALLDFANALVFEAHARDWGTGLYPGPERASATLQLFQAWRIGNTDQWPNLPRVAGPPGSLGGYGAWLYVATPGVYFVLFDELEIRIRCEQSGKSQYETMTNLLFHELGHFVIHQSQLFNVTPPSGAIPADPLMERDAWSFAGILVGLCVGWSAVRMREANGPDRAWELW